MHFADPKKNIEHFRLEPGMLVADFGAGSGEYTLAAARVVGRRGVVYAVDVAQELLGRIEHRATQEGLENVEVVWGDIESRGGTKLTEASIDAVIVSNVLFLLEDMEGAVDEIDRILKRNGKVLVVDWKDSFGGLGPSPDTVVNATEAKELFLQHGFTPEREIEAGANHYGIIFKRS